LYLKEYINDARSHERQNCLPVSKFSIVESKYAFLVFVLCYQFYLMRNLKTIFFITRGIQKNIAKSYT